jgi:hypothetical protein
MKEQDFINEFILMLLEVANENKNIKYIELPEEVKQQNKEYIEENNNILTFINEYYEITKDEKISSLERLNLSNHALIQDMRNKKTCISNKKKDLEQKNKFYNKNINAHSISLDKFNDS